MTDLDLSYDYRSCIEGSEKICWKLDDVMLPDARLDFTRTFLPERLAPTDLALLDAAGARKLNQITSNAYLNLFAFVEEYILQTVVKHAQAELFGDRDAVRALMRFAEEEVKHQQMFGRFRGAFDRDFGTRCEVLESAGEVATIIMQNSPIAVLLLTLHIEVMTQQHYMEAVKDNEAIDPLFASLLKHHWLEESQHARIDVLELQKLVDEASQETIDLGLDEYLGILVAFDGLLQEQAAMDARSLQRALESPLSNEDRKAIERHQLRAYQRTFLWYGMTNRVFKKTVESLSPSRARVIAERALDLE